MTTGQRIFRNMSAIASSVVILLLAASHYFILPLHMNETIQKGRDKALIIQRSIPHLDAGATQDLFQTVSKSDPSLSYIALLDRECRATVHSEPERAGKVYADPGTAAVARDGNPLEQIYTRDADDPGSKYHGEKAYDIMLPTFDRAGNRTGVLSIGISLAKMNAVRFHCYAATLLVAVSLALAIILSTRLVIDRFIKPVEEISGAISRAEPGTPVAVAHADRKDEIGHLAATFNEMSRRLAALLQANGERELDARRELERTVEERAKESHALSTRLAVEISEKSYMEKVMRERETHYKTLVDAAFDVWGETDAEGKYIFISPNNEQMIGFKPDEMIGRYFHEFIHPEDLSKAAGAFEKGIRGSKPVVVLRFRHKEGHYVWIESTGKMYMRDNGEMRAIIVSRDITEQKRFEEEIQKSSKLEALGTLAGGLAHDFNNVLMGIIGNITLAKKRVSGDEKTSEILVRAEKVIYKAKRLTEQLITFSQGGLPIKKLVGVNELVRDTVNFAAAGGNIECRFELAENLPPAEIDEGQFAQVLTNLVINSRQAMPDGGRIMVTTSVRDAGEEPQVPLKPGKYISIALADEGGGIPAENLQRIFDPYFTTKNGGNGLGLATSYSIVKNHDGLITVNSDQGRGAVFTVFVPVKDTSTLAMETQRRFAENYGNKKILLMDDDDTVLIPVCELLADYGYEVSAARNGEEAIGTYEKALQGGKPFDLVILDLVVPGGLGGAETLAKLMTMDPGVVAVVSSGYSSDPVMADHRKHGFMGVLAKPYKDVEMLAVLDGIFGRRGGDADGA